MSAEAGTIAGVASALAMALIGAVSSYISYQQKKFCFSIQRKCSHAVASKPSGQGLARGEGQQWGHDSGPFHSLPKASSGLGFLQRTGRGQTAVFPWAAPRECGRVSYAEWREPGVSVRLQALPAHAAGLLRGTGQRSGGAESQRTATTMTHFKEAERQGAEERVRFAALPACFHFTLSLAASQL